MHSFPLLLRTVMTVYKTVSVNFLHDDILVTVEKNEKPSLYACRKFGSLLTWWQSFILG